METLHRAWCPLLVRCVLDGGSQAVDFKQQKEWVVMPMAWKLKDWSTVIWPLIKVRMKAHHLGQIQVYYVTSRV
jgi:hypothetical protein